MPFFSPSDSSPAGVSPPSPRPRHLSSFALESIMQGHSAC
uniref:Uncharacterized protein n=1 Tax=Arundo donax TaxID=35708 RepID=A0A0A9C572_ARUDO